jgi:hypothetical protein
VTSDKPDEPARALPVRAKTELAIAIRKDDPVRARKLLEETHRDDPGGATPPRRKC